MPTKASHPTEFRLSEVINIQHSVYQTKQATESPPAKTLSKPESEKFINLLLCWAY
jgi:hypothetical protein